MEGGMHVIYSRQQLKSKDPPCRTPSGEKPSTLVWLFLRIVLVMKKNKPQMPYEKCWLDAPKHHHGTVGFI